MVRQKLRERKEDRTEVKLKGFAKFRSLLQEDTSGFHPRLLALSFAASALPKHRAAATRSRLMSLAGFHVGEGTRVVEVPRINGDHDLFGNLTIGRDCWIDVGCVFDLAEKITIGDRVTISPGVMLLTSTHELDIKEHRAGFTQLIPVHIGDGAWLGPRVVILPGVTIGEGSIVEPGAVVNKDVPPQTRVGGMPAAVLETLSTG